MTRVSVSSLIYSEERHPKSWNVERASGDSLVDPFSKHTFQRYLQVKSCQSTRKNRDFLVINKTPWSGGLFSFLFCGWWRLSNGRAKIFYRPMWLEDPNTKDWSRSVFVPTYTNSGILPWVDHKRRDLICVQATFEHCSKPISRCSWIVNTRLVVAVCARQIENHTPVWIQCELVRQRTSTDRKTRLRVLFHWGLATSWHDWKARLRHRSWGDHIVSRSDQSGWAVRIRE